jgi:hypothetical protein
MVPSVHAASWEASINVTEMRSYWKMKHKCFRITLNIVVTTCRIARARFPAQGRDLPFIIPVHTCSRAHPDSYFMGTEGSFPVDKGTGV